MLTIMEGHVMDRLRELPAGSVQCCVTSPPYWGLRDYGTPPQVWGGETGCAHGWCEEGPGHHPGQVEQTKWKSAVAAGAGGNAGSGAFCRLCKAWRGHLGLEPTPELYTAHLVEIFREVRRVLRKDGILWLNLGDCYASKPFYDGDTFDPKWKQARNRGRNNGPNRQPLDGLKPKDLVGIPWRVAFALQADGWWLRSDIVWAKPNPIPESVTDRPTRSHEYVFLMSKAERYFYDAAAIAEPALNEGRVVSYSGDEKTNNHENRTYPVAQPKDITVNATRNKRDVWTIPVQPFPEAHFATFPPKLAETCILAGSRLGDTVLDPFLGAGTTGLMAHHLGRGFTGIELNPEYVDMAKWRILGPLFTGAEARA